MKIPLQEVFTWIICTPPPQSTVKSNSEIFSAIYAKGGWSRPVDGEKFNSGSGSHNEQMIVPYINMLTQLLMNNGIRNIVDIGCGDFWVMRHVLELLDQNNFNYFYTGIDVVEAVIKHNAETFKALNKRFICRDAAADNEPLPNGELLIIRQVLQHLSNADIQKILAKATHFKFMLISESIYDAPDAVHNVDMNAGGSIRIRQKSGVYLEYPPYEFKNIVHILKVPDGNKRGVAIRSSLIIN